MNDRILVYVNLSALSQESLTSSFNLSGLERVFIEDYLPANSLIEQAIFKLSKDKGFASIKTFLAPKVSYSFLPYKDSLSTSVELSIPRVLDWFFSEIKISAEYTREEIEMLFLNQVYSDLNDILNRAIDSSIFFDPAKTLYALEQWQQHHGIRVLRKLIDTYLLSRPNAVDSSSLKSVVNTLRCKLPSELQSVAIACDSGGHLLYASDITSNYRFFEVFSHQ